MAVQKRSGPLEWDDLRVFVTLARAGSLSAAARELRVSHATVGRRIAALEETLGRTLFDRRADGYVLTAEGAGMLELVTRRLASLAYGVYAAPHGDTSAWVGLDDSLAHLPEAQWLARHAAGARLVLRANTLSGQLAAARAGFGKALLPRWFADEEGGLIALPPPAPPPVREAWLVVHPDLKDVPRVRAVIDAVVAAFEEAQERLGPGRP